MKYYKKMSVLCALIFLVIICVSCLPKHEVISPKEIGSNREPFTGDTYQYEYAIEDGKAREWEEDIIFFAKTLLQRGHPMVGAHYVDVFIEENYTRGDMEVQAGAFYDSTLKKNVIEQIDSLLASIPILEDYEIPYKMQEILAQFHDIHTSVRIEDDFVYPFQTVPIFGDEVEFCLVGVPKEKKKFLYSKVEKINGISMDEVLEKFKKIISYENNYSFIQKVNVALFQKDTLKYLGIGKKEKIKLTIRDKDGKRRTIAQKVVSKDEMAQMDMVRHESVSKTLLKDSHDEKEYYWYEYFNDENTIYMRYNFCLPREDIKLRDMLKEMEKTIEENGGVAKYILDLRSNPGGYLDEARYFSPFILWLQEHPELVEKVYVLIDERTASTAVIIASLLKKNVNYATFIGNGTAQGPNFFSGYVYESKNYNIKFSISSFHVNVWPKYEEETFMPDILLTPTIEDYRTGIDSVLEAVLDDSFQ